MSFIRKITDFAKKTFTPPRPTVRKGDKPTPSILRMTLSRLNEMRRRFRLGNRKVTGAFGRKRIFIDPRPANGAGSGPRPNTWWKQTHSHRHMEHAGAGIIHGLFVHPPIFTAPEGDPKSRRPVGDRSRDRNKYRRHPLGGIIQDKWARA